jgi:hypothetical protein
MSMSVCLILMTLTDGCLLLFLSLIVQGWHLDFPFLGDSERKIPQHSMNRWDNNKGEPYIVFVAKLGSSIAYRDLPSNLKTNNIAQHFGATPELIAGAGTIICGSHGEIANDRSLREPFDFRSNEEQMTSAAIMDNQRHVVWYELALWAVDQLRQRMGFSLSELITVVPQNIDGETYTEVYAKYYDFFVKHVSRIYNFFTICLRLQLSHCFQISPGIWQLWRHYETCLVFASYG